MSLQGYYPSSQQKTTLDSSLIRLFDILQYGDEKSEETTETVPTPDLNTPDGFPVGFPLTAIDICFRCRPGTAPSRIFSSSLSSAPKRHFKSSQGLIWMEAPETQPSPNSRYINSISPSLWGAKLKTGLPQKPQQDEELQTQSSEELQFTQTPRGPRRQRQPPSQQRQNISPSAPHISTSSALPFPQLLPASSDSSTYDPISLTLSLFGFGGGHATTSNTRPGPMDETDLGESPLFVRSTSIIDRQKFISGLYDLRDVIRQVRN